MSVEQVMNMAKLKDGFHLADPFGNEISWADFMRVLQFEENKDKIKKKKEKSTKSFKNGSRENWDQEYRVELNKQKKKLKQIQAKERKEFDKNLKKQER